MDVAEPILYTAFLSMVRYRMGPNIWPISAHIALHAARQNVHRKKAKGGEEKKGGGEKREKKKRGERDDSKSYRVTA